MIKVFLRIPGVEGDAMEWYQRDSMNLIGFRWECRGGWVNTLVVRKPLDKASTILAKACPEGRLFEHAEINAAVEVKGRYEVFYWVRLGTLQIVGYSVEAPEVDPASPTEVIPVEELKLSLSGSETAWRERTRDGRLNYQLPYPGKWCSANTLAFAGGRPRRRFDDECSQAGVRYPAPQNETVVSPMLRILCFSLP